MIFKTVTSLALRLVRLAGSLADAPERPLIVASTCQSELKRTLRRASPRPKTVPSRGFADVAAAHSTQMVNGGFPEPASYGFERVDATGSRFSAEIRPSIENLHRIKSVGFFANFRRFKLNANTCDLSTAVSQGIDCENNRNGCEVHRRSLRYSQRNQKRRPGSRDVFSASHGILARAGARAFAQREDA